MEGVPRMPMLEIELKQNSFDYSTLDWSGMPSYDAHEITQQQITEALKKHIKEEYGDDPEKYKDAIEKFIELQSQAYKAILSPDFEGCNTLKKYYGHLHYMQSRFPFTGDASIKVTFPWQDAFTGMLTVHDSFSFEQSAILFNIGAVHSQLGAMDNRTSEEGIRISCVHFQCAAGLFTYIADHFDTTMSADISQAMLKLFINIMLAQGQECLLEKSMQDNRKHSIVSKISQQVVEYYEQCMQSLGNRENENTLGSQAYKYWKKVVNFKILYYSAITKYYLGNNAQDQDKYGQAVGFFGWGIELLGEAAKLAKNFPKETRLKAEEALRFTSDVLNGKYVSLVKDNNYVYHDKVPDKSSLPEIKGASLVKALPFEPANPTLTGPDIFAKLVPMEAHLAASTYSEEKAKLLRTVVENINEKDETLKHYKQSIELDPRKLISLEGSSKLDQELIERSAQLSVDQSPIDQLKQSMEDLTDVYSELDSVLNDILSIVEQEETEDQKFKNTCGKDAFSSQEDVEGIKKELQVYKERYHKASQNNENLHTACRIHITNMKLVAEGIDSLKEEINLINIADLLTDEDKKVVELIHKLCDKVVEMEEQRKNLLQQLRQQMESDDVTSTLVTKHGVDQEDLFKEELKKHDSVIDTINQNLSAQDNILAAVTEANALYTKIRKKVETEKERVDSKVNNLLLSCNSFNDVLQKGVEGKKFFTEVLENSVKLSKRCEELYKENQEKREKMYKKHEEKEKAKRPPPRPTAPKPKLAPKKKTPSPQSPPAAYPISPDILAKMMVEDDDELLNDPEFLQFLQAQGELQPGGMLPVMSGASSTSYANMPPFMPGTTIPHMQSRTNTFSPSNQSPTSSPLSISTPHNMMQGFVSQSAPPMSPPVSGTYIPRITSQSFAPAMTLHPHHPGISSPLPMQIQSLPSQSNPVGQIAPSVPDMSQHNQAFRHGVPVTAQQGYNRYSAGLDSSTVNIMSRPVSSLQDPRQIIRPNVSVPYQAMQVPNIQGYNTFSPHAQYNAASLPVASSPGPIYVQNESPVAMQQLPYQQAPPIISHKMKQHPISMPPQSYIPQMVPPSTHQMGPGQHTYHPGQQVDQQPQQIPVQVSQVAIVYSAPPPPQQSSACSYTQPGSFSNPAVMTQSQQPGTMYLPNQPPNPSYPMSLPQPASYPQAASVSLPAVQAQMPGPTRHPMPHMTPPISNQQIPHPSQSPNVPFQNYSQHPAYQPQQQPQYPPSSQYTPNVPQNFQPQISQNSSSPQLQRFGVNNNMGSPNVQSQGHVTGQYQAQPQMSLAGQQPPPAQSIQQPTYHQQAPRFVNQNVPWQMGGSFQPGNPQTQPNRFSTPTPPPQSQQYPSVPQSAQNSQIQQQQAMTQPQAPVYPVQQGHINEPRYPQQNMSRQQHISGQPGGQHVQGGGQVQPQGYQQPQQTMAPPGHSYNVHMRSSEQNGQTITQLPQQTYQSMPHHQNSTGPPYNMVSTPKRNQQHYNTGTVMSQQPNIQPGPPKTSMPNVTDGVSTQQNRPENTMSPQQQGYAQPSMSEPVNNATPPVQNASLPQQQNYTFKSQPHPGQYHSTPSNENSPKHAPAQITRPNSQTSANNVSNPDQATNFVGPMEIMTPTPINAHKPTPLPPQPSSDLAGLILTPTRSISTSADELLSTSADTSIVAVKDDNQIVLVPTKVDEDSDSMVVRPVEGLPYMDEADLMKFKGQVVEFRGKVSNLLHKPDNDKLCPLDREWKQLSETQEKHSRQLSTAVARCSSYKNKFQDIVPFDQSRVILRQAKDDYINASVIDGVSPFCPRFLATQSPLPNTCSDFWLMVYEQQISLIVMLVNSKDVTKKCPIYWPADRSVPQQHGPLTVAFTTSKTHGDLYIERTFTVKHKNQSLAMSVTQLQYIAWPEHRLPSSASDLLTFMHIVLNYHGLQRNLQLPVLVHCDSGVGRTGVFCAFLAGINEINAGMGIMDVHDIVTKMRKKRKYMVQEKAQLKFVYDVILYHAIDVLKQRRVILEDEIKLPSTPQQTHHPVHPTQSSSQFDIFSDQSALFSIQATVEKMTIKQGNEKTKYDTVTPVLSSASCSQIPTVANVEFGSKINNSNPISSASEIITTTSRDSVSPPANLADLSDLVRGTIIPPVQATNHPVYEAPDAPRDTNVISKPDVVESCNNPSVGETNPPGLNGITHVDPVRPALIDSLSPETFTLETTEQNAKKRVTKEDFFKPSSGLISESDPTDPFSGLDPLWGHKK